MWYNYCSSMEILIDFIFVSIHSIQRYQFLHDEEILCIQQIIIIMLNILIFNVLYMYEKNTYITSIIILHNKCVLAI